MTLQTKSILRLKGNDISPDEIKDIENLTRGKVTRIEVSEQELKIYLDHHDGPVCPECGGKIHDYGHGLCYSCWRWSGWK